MKTFIGPIEWLRFKEKIDAEQRKLANIFYGVVFVIPLFVLVLCRFGVLEGTSKVSETQLGMVGVVNSGGSLGTTFLISETQLLTAAHVVEYADVGDRVTIKFEKNPKTYDAVVAFKPRENSEVKDYAVLELVDAKFKNYFALAKSEDLVKTNDAVGVIGYPDGTFNDAIGQITNTSWRGQEERLQLWAPAWPGNSGGPVIHKESGKVIGILVAGDVVNDGMIIAVKTDLLYADMELNKVVNLEAIK